MEDTNDQQLFLDFDTDLNEKITPKDEVKEKFEINPECIDCYYADECSQPDFVKIIKCRKKKGRKK
jgi:hypothetical protein